MLDGVELISNSASAKFMRTVYLYGKYTFFHSSLKQNYNWPQQE